jgi:glycosyltransferase involved in cell wall biosynthesis
MKILWIPHAGWHIPQRAHLFCRELAERHEVHVTDWAADFASPRETLSRRYLRSFSYRQRQDGRIRVHGIPRISPALFLPALRRLNTLLFSRAVEHIIDRWRIEAVVGTFVVPPPRAGRLVFDLFDENAAGWRRGGQASRYALEIERVEQEYLRAADVVVAASQVLAEKARAGGARGPVCLIPNGIDLSRFERASGASFRRAAGMPGAVAGSIGNHDQPAELRKVLAAAQALAGDEVTFLVAGRGSAVKAAQARARTEGISNVRFSGFVPAEKLAEAIGALDVGLCPYAKTPMDEARSPMRLLAYAAAGIPTVCTDLEEVRRMGFPNVLLVEDHSAAFAEGVRLALQLPRGRPPQIDAYDIKRLAAAYERILSA